MSEFAERDNLRRRAATIREQATALGRPDVLQELTGFELLLLEDEAHEKTGLGKEWLKSCDDELQRLEAKLAEVT